MTEYFALTEKGSVAAEKIIVATKNPIVTSRGAYWVKLGSVRGYTIAVDCAPKPCAHVSEYRQGRDFFFLLQESVAAYDRRAEKRTCRGGVGAAAQIRPGILSGGARALFLEK